MSGGGVPSQALLGGGRDVLTVARFELAESLRTRRVLFLVLLFLVGGGVSAWGFARAVAEAERATAQMLGAPTTDRPGAAFERLRKTSAYGGILKSMVKDPEMASALEAVPPLALVFAWLTMFFAPTLVLLGASDSVAEEVGSRGVRYSLLRTGRSEYVLGKFCGQLLLLCGVVGLAGLTFFVVASFTLASLTTLDAALGILRFWPWVILDVLPYLGLAFLASMLGRSGAGARVYAVLGAILLSILHGLAQWEWLRRGPIASALLDLVDYLTPFPRGLGVLAPPGPILVRAVASCLGLTALYLGLGLWWFRRRDL